MPSGKSRSAFRARASAAASRGNRWGKRVGFELLERRLALANIGFTFGADDISVEVDSYGAFGSALSGALNYDETGGASGSMASRSFVAVGLSTPASSHSVLGEYDGWNYSTAELSAVTATVSSDGSAATTSFQLPNSGGYAALQDIDIELTQAIEPVFDDQLAGSQATGALLTQTYRMTNTGSLSRSFDMRRVVDGDFGSIGASNGGGKYVAPDGREWGVTFADASTGMTLQHSDLMIAVSVEGGNTPSIGRQEAEPASAAYYATQLAGQSLSDAVYNDGSDTDEIADVGFDLAYSMRRQFTMVAGEEATFVVYTLFSIDSTLDLQDIVDGVSDYLSTPVITDVSLAGSAWALAPHQFASRIANGWQFRPLAQSGIDIVEIQFSKQVEVVMDDMMFVQTVSAGQGNATTTTLSNYTFSYDVATRTARWQFTSALADGKYAIHLNSSITDYADVALDGDWSNAEAGHAGTPDSWQDDPARTFNVGNGVPGAEGGEFRLHFAVLAYDYDGSGLVDSADVAVWTDQAANGAGSEPLADANGDGAVTAADEPQAALGATLPLRYDDADYIDDERVNAVDLGAWYLGYTLQYLDGNDFVVWQGAFLDSSSWYVDQDNSSLVQTSLAPQITDVVVSGYYSTHADYSFDTAGADGSGAQLAPGPVGGADTITIVFNQPVNVTSDALTVVGLQSANAPALVEFTYDAATNSATWRFESWALADQFLIAVDDAVTGANGYQLDGEWTNPASITATNSSGMISSFPSGDGVEGGDFVFVMSLLPGDADLNGVVDQTDSDILGDNIGLQLGALFTDGDFNGDGDVDIWDYFATGDAQLMMTNWGVDLQTLEILADFDSDLDVDSDDLAVLNANVGSTNATWSDGDLDGDGDVDADDYDLIFALIGSDLEADV
ncbi:MAG: hypothetical protein KDA61_18575 [Planctomycetales bacterium]|nr:hypothetical protein [Planctomycetales bacterium]